MNALVIRCNTGTVVWVRVQLTRRVAIWRCTRDQFTIPAPASPEQIEPTLLALAAHSISLSGAIQQIAYLVV